MSKEFSGETLNRKQIKAMEGSSGDLGLYCKPLFVDLVKFRGCCSSETGVCPCGRCSDLWMLVLSHCHAAGLAELNLKGSNLDCHSHPASITIPYPLKLAREAPGNGGWVASPASRVISLCFSNLFIYGCAGSLLLRGLPLVVASRAAL